MDCFEALGINPTKDTKEIKRAYSKMLQIHSPETDPEGFQKIREAYEEAIAKAGQEDLSDKTITPVEEFMAKFKDCYDNFDKRIDENSWKELLDSDICCNIETGKEISDKILTFMMSSYNYPYEIWSLFNNYFSWTSKKEKLYQQFPKNFIDFIIYKITNKTYFRYDYVKNCQKGQEENFLTEYSKANNALEEYDLYNAKKSLEKAKEVCGDHPDLLILTSRYLMTNGQLEEAKSILSSVIENNEKDLFAYYYRGNLFFRLGKFNDAYNDYKKGLEIKPDFIDILYSIGKCSISLGKYEEASEYFEKLTDLAQYNRDVRVLLNSAYSFQLDDLTSLAEQNPDNIDLKFKLAKAYYACHKTEESYNILSEIEQSGHMNCEMYVLLCKVLYDSEKKELSYSTAFKAYELYPQDFSITFYKACMLDEYGKYEEAISYYDKALALKPDDAVSFSNKAYALNKLKRYSEALESANYAIKIDEYMAHAYKNKAEALLGLELYQECLAACEEALNIFVYLTDVYVIKMKLYSRVGQFDEALNVFNKAIDNGLKESSLFIQKANVLRLTQKYDEAISLCDQAIELDENSKDVHYCKGLCYFNKEKYKEAIECFESSIQKSENMGSSYYYKILSLLNSSNHKEALRELANAISLKLENVDRFYELKGDVLSFQNQYNEALEEYKKAIEIDPACSSYYYSMGYNLNNLSKFEDALQYLNKAIELDPTVANYFICKSHSLYTLGKYKACIEECDKALEVEPDYMPAFRNKAWAFYKLGNVDEAEKFCQNALKIDGSNVNLLYLKVNILRQKGLNQDALIVCDRIHEIDPEDQEIIGIRKELLQGSKAKKGFLGTLFGK
ncbi:J domain-containing protein [Acetivibrio cellulolyticus]|uniref:J domain-containing protein n=1 Tax=Acetivibrio cellulolyticus TaxID=35830 RepID=UPI0001E2C2AE|nr:tetratricopeptide repeat protein [Acetivibrio cellulolyticus]